MTAIAYVRQASVSRRARPVSDDGEWSDKWSHCRSLDDAVAEVGKLRASSGSDMMYRAQLERRKYHSDIRMQAAQWTREFPDDGALQSNTQLA